MKGTFLVTGGAGYIGSHTVLALLNLGCHVVVLDNFSNSSRTALKKVSLLANRDFCVVSGDIRDASVIDRIFHDHHIDGVLHFAGLKSVSESLSNPLLYSEVNVSGTITLLQSMERAGVNKVVFSSSATVYGEPPCTPVKESFPVGRPSSSYGKNKLYVEQLLTDLISKNSQWSVAILRYFNPIGAHPSGLIGESPTGVPNNLLPYLTQVALGKRDALWIFGNDYPTVDGTGVRDYIHVDDLADGHLKALNYILNHRCSGVWNLGTGVPYSVLQVVREFESAVGKSIPYKFTSRRQGDIAECWADAEKAKSELGWLPTRDLRTMLIDSWRWQQNNPDGYVD